MLRGFKTCLQGFGPFVCEAFCWEGAGKYDVPSCHPTRTFHDFLGMVVNFSNSEAPAFGKSSERGLGRQEEHDGNVGGTVVRDLAGREVSLPLSRSLLSIPIHPSTYLSVYLSIYLSACLSVFLSIFYLSISLPLSLSHSLSHFMCLAVAYSRMRLHVCRHVCVYT